MMIKAAAATVALAVVGRSYLRLLFPRPAPRPTTETLALSWLVGVGVLGWMTHVGFLLIGRAPAWIWVIFSSAVVLDAAVHLRPIAQRIADVKRKAAWGAGDLSALKTPDVTRPNAAIDSVRPTGQALTTRRNLRGKLAALPPLALLILQSGFLIASSPSYTQGWDGTIIWDVKAKAIYMDALSHPGAMMAHLNSPDARYQHPDYPLLLPSAGAWVYFWVGTADEQALKLIGPSFMISILLLLVARLSRILPAALALLFACLLTTAPYLFNLSKTGYAEIPLAAMAGAAAAYGADRLRTRESGSLWLMLFFAGCATLVKKDGLMMAGVLLVAMTAALLSARQPSGAFKFLLKAAALLAGIAGPWAIFLAIHKIPGGDFVPASYAFFQAHWKRSVEVFTYIPKLMSEKELFGRFWAIVAVVPLIGVARWRRPHLVFLGLSCAGYLMAISGIYIFSAWNPYWVHVQSSLSRLLTHVAPVALLFAGHSVAERFFSKRPEESARAASQASPREAA